MNNKKNQWNKEVVLYKISKTDKPIAKLTKRKKEDQKKKKRILYRENKDKHSHDNMGNNKSQ
jgi:hypothetical protein